MFKGLARRYLQARGYTVTRSSPTSMAPMADLEADPDFMAVHARCAPFTMTSMERMYAAYQAACYVARAGVGGDIVECGVWRGGSAMVMALALLRLGETSRTLFLYDTFEGMTAPGEEDRAYDGRAAANVLRQTGLDSMERWCRAPLDEVRSNLASTGYPSERIVLVKGRVEDTIPNTIPGRIAVLRLDTDWYASTLHELRHLYPVLVDGGVLIVDDYGFWKGSRAATDQYLAENRIPMLLTRIDNTGRLGLKVRPP